MGLIIFIKWEVETTWKDIEPITGELFWEKRDSMLTEGLRKVLTIIKEEKLVHLEKGNFLWK